MIYPLIPLFLVGVLGVNMAMVGLIEGIAESTASLLKVFFGWFSDRIGQRKSLMLAGYAISTLSRPIMAMERSLAAGLGFTIYRPVGQGYPHCPQGCVLHRDRDPVRPGQFERRLSDPPGGAYRYPHAHDPDSVSGVQSRLFPVVYSGRDGGGQFKATAFGVYAAAVGFAMLPASLIAGWLWDHVSPAATFYFGAATATLSALLFIVLMIRTGSSPRLT